MNLVNKKLDEFENYIRGKKVAIIGLGVSNIPLIDYFYNLGASVAFFDKRPVEKLDKEAVQKIHNYNFDLYLGENNLENLKGFSIIFRSPSCRPDTPEIIDEVRNMIALTLRKRNIIEYLLSRDSYVTNDVIASNFEVSNRTVRKDLEVISAYLKEQGIENLGINFYE